MPRPQSTAPAFQQPARPMNPNQPPQSNQPSELPSGAEEDDVQLRREFYAWCSACQGFGSIF